MLQKTIDVSLLGDRILELLSDIQNQTEVTLMRDGIPFAKILPLPCVEKVIPKAGLNFGSMVMAEDFNEPLPDDFWGL